MENTDKLMMEVTGLFMRYGIKSMTMDDVARQMRISKKTLYKHVDDKKDLVQKCMKWQCWQEQHVIEQIIEQNDNAIDELIAISQWVSQVLSQMHPSIHFDLEKYYPKAWGEFDSHRNQFILGCVTNNLRRGQEQAYYRKDMDIDIVAKLYIAKIDVVFDGQVFPQPDYSFNDVHHELVHYHMHGIATEKGIKYFDQRIRQEHINFHK